MMSILGHPQIVLKPRTRQTGGVSKEKPQPKDILIRSLCLRKIKGREAPRFFRGVSGNCFLISYEMFTDREQISYKVPSNAL
uniref:Uncharacterized protein n=1 Tax=Rhinopithecus roxellana TaxID=61622 RepID=A0A2K6RDY1_RHIRO